MEQPDIALTHQYLEPRADSDGPSPALVLLHGRGADELDLLSLGLALDPRLTIVSARAPFQMGPGYHWYGLKDIGVPEPQSFAHSMERLTEFPRQIIERYNIDPKRLYLLGFSQGAVMAGALTLTQPEQIAGTIGLSGYLPLHSDLPIATEKMQGQPYFIGHGTQDQVLGVELGRKARDFLTEVGADLTYREYDIAHHIAEPELRDIATWLTRRIDQDGAAE